VLRGRFNGRAEIRWETCLMREKKGVREDLKKRGRKDLMAHNQSRHPEVEFQTEHHMSAKTIKAAIMPPTHHCVKEIWAKKI
jgi:hypothetical protein